MVKEVEEETFDLSLSLSSKLSRLVAAFSLLIFLYHYEDANARTYQA